MHLCEIEVGKKILDTYPKSTDMKNVQPMSTEASKNFISLVMAEAGKAPEAFRYENLAGRELPFASAAIQKRVEALKLPIQFSMQALLAPYVFCEQIGGAIVLLCDCLHHFRDRIVTMTEITELYPWGFYKPEVLRTIIDDYMKAGKHPWAKVYGCL